MGGKQLPRELPALLVGERLVDRKSPDAANVLLAQCEDVLKRPNSWRNIYPTVELEVGGSEDDAKYIYANRQAVRMYGCSHENDIIGQSVNVVDGRLEEWIVGAQLEGFNNEQKGLFAHALLWPATKHNLMSSVPLWFTAQHPATEFQLQCFLPVLVQKTEATHTVTRILRVSFIPITHWVRKAALNRDSRAIALPHDWEAYHDVFECDVMCIGEQNSLMALAVAGILAKEHIGVGPCPDGCDDLGASLTSARVVVLLVGPDGLQEAMEKALVAELPDTKPVVVVHAATLEAIKMLPDLRKKLESRPWIHFADGDSNAAEHASRLRSVVRLVRDILRQELRLRTDGK